MGTSTSSSGPGPGVPFDPPWLEPLQSEMGQNAPPEQQPENPEDGAEGEFEPHEPDGQLAPPRRFAPARRQLSDYAATGDKGAFRRAVGHYSRTGMGGARRAAGRMRVSTVAAGGLVSLLQAARDGTDPAVNEWIQALTATNPLTREVIDAIVRQVAGIGGTVDEDSIRDSMAYALSELVSEQPDVNPLSMTDTTSGLWSSSIWRLSAAIVSKSISDSFLKARDFRLWMSCVEPTICVNT